MSVPCMPCLLQRNDAWSGELCTPAIPGATGSAILPIASRRGGFVLPPHAQAQTFLAAAQGLGAAIIGKMVEKQCIRSAYRSKRGAVTMGVFGNGWSIPGSDIWGVITLVVLVLIVVGIVLLIRSVMQHDHAHVPPGPPQGPAWGAPPDAGTNSALRVLEERYARGEIDREDFLQRKHDILGG